MPPRAWQLIPGYSANRRRARQISIHNSKTLYSYSMIGAVASGRPCLAMKHLYSKKNVSLQYELKFSQLFDCHYYIFLVHPLKLCHMSAFLHIGMELRFSRLLLECLNLILGYLSFCLSHLCFPFHCVWKLILSVPLNLVHVYHEQHCISIRIFGRIQFSVASRCQARKCDLNHRFS